ncbi:hypothetical protein AN958_12322 [Leucoagaricus sp. SymC.cos]|nr:hypothetical protein AN958_12322 [Leucoagaricus sp. SymC.cos]
MTRQNAHTSSITAKEESTEASLTTKHTRKRGEITLTANEVRKRQASNASSSENGIKNPPMKRPRLAPEDSHLAPDNWKVVYDTIKVMRSRITAPADIMGCEQSKYKESDPKNRRFTTLVYLILSSQTKDEVTDAAVTKLRNAIGGTLSVKAILSVDESVIAESINKVGFWRRKAGYIKQAAQRLRDDFDSDVPKTMDDLCSLSGVGPKMAILVLHVAWDINQGIGVDSHVHRITNRLGWHSKPTKDAEETRLNLQSWLPSELHREINLMLVGFGQIICTPTKPQCDACELSTKGLCPSVQKGSKGKRQKPATISAQESPALPRISIEVEAEP